MLNFVFTLHTKSNIPAPLCCKLLHILIMQYIKANIIPVFILQYNSYMIDNAIPVYQVTGLL